MYLYIYIYVYVYYYFIDISIVGFLQPQSSTPGSQPPPGGVSFTDFTSAPPSASAPAAAGPTTTGSDKYSAFSDLFKIEPEQPKPATVNWDGPQGGGGSGALQWNSTGTISSGGGGLQWNSSSTPSMSTSSLSTGEFCVDFVFDHS